jgi:hypothetical protein
MKQFSSEVISKLKYYVYLLSDPSNGEIFYVGKGKGNRVFSHFKETGDSDKVKKIKEIKKKGLEPKIEILVHGVDDETTIKKIEAAIIDLIDKTNLTNIVGGYESSDFGRMDLNQINAKYSSKKAHIDENVVLIKLSQTFRYNMSAQDLYDNTRGIWVISEERRKKTKFAFAVYDGVIQETYEIQSWFRAGSTYASGRTDIERWKKIPRYEFVGNISMEMRKKYLHKSVDHYWKAKAQNPMRYTY